MASKVLVLVLLAGVAGCASLPGAPTPTLTENHELGADAGSPGNAAGGLGKAEELFALARDIEANGNDGGETALALYRDAVVQSGRTPAAYVQLGDACLRAGKLGAAIAAYRAALAKDHDSADALLGLGTAFARQGALTKALAALGKAAPRVNTGAAYNRLGVTQTMAGQFSEAEKTLEMALSLQSDDLDIATNLALAQALAGETEKAVTLTGEIAQLPTVKPVHRRNLVIVLGIVGRSAKDARTVAPPDLPQREFDALFRRAQSIRHITDPKARARALGTMQG